MLAIAVIRTSDSGIDFVRSFALKPFPRNDLREQICFLRDPILYRNQDRMILLNINSIVDPLNNFFIHDNLLLKKCAINYHPDAFRSPSSLCSHQETLFLPGVAGERFAFLSKLSYQVVFDFWRKDFPCQDSLYFS